MRPTGTLSVLCRVSPKKNATALCGGIVWGVVTSHTASTSSSGSREILCATLKWRMSGQFAAATSFSQSFTLRRELIVNSMLLCPEQNHTSPTTTFLNTSAFSPATWNSAPSAHAFSGASAVFQRPCASAVAVAVCPAKDTVTFSPGAALPHTGTRCPCWSTMLSPNTRGIVTAAAHSMAANSAATTVNKIFFICFSFQSCNHFTVPVPRRKAYKRHTGKLRRICIFTHAY